MKYSVLHSFPSKNVIPVPEPLFFLYKEIIKDISEPIDNLYAIGFQYTDKSIQFGITGTLETDESPKHGMIREIAEECGLLVEPTKIHKMKTRKSSKITQQWWVQSFHISNIHSTYFPSDSTKRDNKRLKVGSIIYGSMDELYRKIKVVCDLQFQSSDMIETILIFPLKWFENVKVYNFIIKN